MKTPREKMAFNLGGTMNWEVLLAAVIVAVAMVISANKLRMTQHTVLADGRRSAIASMSALFVAARLTDKEYVERINTLRTTVKYALQEYPGSPERLKEVEGEVEIAREMLREIDYDQAEVRMRWIELASRMYRECPDFSE
jgi:methyl coenzyme M reductase gamma subunit